MRLAFLTLTFAFSKFIYAQPSFPKYDFCTSSKSVNNCGLLINQDGFLIDISNGKKISDVSENTGIMSSVSLYKNENTYIFERLDFTSSRNRQWIIFSYADKQITIHGFYNFSQGLLEGRTPEWYGYECRETKPLHKNKNLMFSESAKKSICENVIFTNAIENEQGSDPSKDISLYIKIPVYNSKESPKIATYLFLNSNKPDIFKMTCKSNCALPLKDIQDSRYD